MRSFHSMGLKHSPGIFEKGGSMKLTRDENPKELKTLYGHLKPATGWGQVRCRAWDSEKKWRCTLEKYHPMPHAAHAFWFLSAIWDDEVVR